MSDDRIKVTCTSCSSTIRAPRAAAGKRGKCPKCGNPVYVPTPDDELEEIPLEPLEENSDELLRESAALASDLLREKGTPDSKGRGSSGPSAPRDEQPAPAINVSTGIVQYLVAIKESKLDDSGAILAELVRAKPQALNRIQQMMVDAMPPPQLGDLPPPLYMAFLKKLQSELEE